MSLTDRLEKFFRAHPGMWIDGMELARFAGSYAWRTRASELRTQRGLDIENRVRFGAAAERSGEGERIPLPAGGADDAVGGPMTPTQWLIGAGLVAMFVLYVRTLLRMAAQRSEWEQPLLPQRRLMVERAQRELAEAARRGR
jgi:hypothetical protein